MLSTNVIQETDDILGEGTFGLVKRWICLSLNCSCAIKVGKHKYFDALTECRVMQKFDGSPYFPYVFGLVE